MTHSTKAPSFFGRLRRFSQILLFVAQLPQQSSVLRGDDRVLARWTKAKIVELGVTFIKLGQILSTRSDLLSAAWIEELATLHDKVENPASFDPIKEIIESDLGAPLDELFLEVETEPFRVASIGQIHRARREREGQVVEQVIKVQKPGVAEEVRRDLSLLRSIIQHLMIFPRVVKSGNLFGLLDELETTFGAELDYRIEAENTDTFAGLFSDPQTRVLIPKVDHERSSQHVLTLDYLPSIKVTEYVSNTENMEVLATTLVGAFLKQFAVDGIFHADPHPGNLGVQVGPDGRPWLVLYDFGMVGKLSPEMRKSILAIAGSAIRRDVNGLIYHCVDAGMMNPAMLNDADGREVIRRFVSKLDNISAETVGVLQQQLFKASEKGDFNFPQELTFVGRSLVSLEGVLKIIQKSSRELKLNRVILSQTLPLAAHLFEEPVNPMDRAEYDTQRLLKNAGQLALGATSLFDKLERGELHIPVHDSEQARVVRRLRYGQKSIAAAILFAAFLAPGMLIIGVAENAFLGLPLLAVSLVFLERWYLAEQRLDN